MAAVKNKVRFWPASMGQALVKSQPWLTFLLYPPHVWGKHIPDFQELLPESDTPLYVWGKPLPLECKPYNSTACGFDYELIAF